MSEPFAQSTRSLVGHPAHYLLVVNTAEEPLREDLHVLVTEALPDHMTMVLRSSGDDRQGYAPG